MILVAVALAAAFAAGGPVETSARAEITAKRCAKKPTAKQRKACRCKRARRCRRRRPPTTAAPPRAQPTPAPSASPAPTPSATPPPPAPTPTPTWTPDPGAEPWFLTVYARDVGNGDFRLTPFIGELPAGRLLLSYKNTDPGAHDLWLRRRASPEPDVRLFEPSSTEELRRTELTLPPGAYAFLCKLPGHETMRLDFTAR